MAIISAASSASLLAPCFNQVRLCHDHKNSSTGCCCCSAAVVWARIGEKKEHAKSSPNPSNLKSKSQKEVQGRSLSTCLHPTNVLRRHLGNRHVKSLAYGGIPYRAIIPRVHLVCYTRHMVCTYGKVKPTWCDDDTGTTW